jgi:thioredoxin reductase
MAADDPSISRRNWLRVSAAIGASWSAFGCGPNIEPKEIPAPRGEKSMMYDVVIVGGGPAGLAAALTLGRARKNVLLCDAGPRRNALASHIHNFVTRDGTPPEEFRKISRQQLETYPNVQIRDAHVDKIEGAKGNFSLHIGHESVHARRVVLSLGVIDEMLPIEGFRELWGHSIFQCPYCHGWEVKDQIWGVLALNPMIVTFAIHLRGWTRNVIVFTNATHQLSADDREQLEKAKVQVETRAIQKLVAKNGHLESIALTDGNTISCKVLYAHPPQKHVEIVNQLGLALDEHGSVKVDPMHRETSVPGIYAAGDLTSRIQAAVAAAAAGTLTGAMLNHELTAEMVLQGLL